MTGQPASRAESPPTKRLVTLGSAGLYAEEKAEPLLGPGKPLALLLYLALTPGRRVSREFLLDLLWADLDRDRARSALRQVLFHLRRLLGEGALLGTEELLLAWPIATDRDRFLAAVERGDLDLAVDAYTGEFLPAFGVPGGAAFEQWSDLERLRLRAAFLRSGEILVSRHLNASRFREAQRLARRVREEVPDSEAGWRLLLESVIAGRDFMAAAVEAEAVERWAAIEGRTLESTTRLAIARARQVKPDEGETHHDATLIAELTGREREFSAITSAWESARLGPARHLHLTAPAGLGKTRLLRDAIARLRAAGGRVVETRGAPGERDIPYAFAADLASALAALPGAAGITPASASILLGLNPALSRHLAGTPDPATGEDALRRRTLALTDLVQAVADETPFALVIDDLHWVDTQSYRALEGLFGRLGAAPVLCLTAGRPELRPAGEGVMLLPLAPLTPAHVSSFVSGLGAIPDGTAWSPSFVTRLHRATRGSPLLILETLRLALEEQVLRLEGSEWHCPDDTRLSDLLREGEALRQRVRGLPTDQGWILALMATAGTPLPLESLAKAAEQPAAAVSELLEGLERQGLAVRGGTEWAVAHDEIASAARDAIQPGRQVVAHRTLGRLLVARSGSDAQGLFRGVRHLLASGDHHEVRDQFRRYARLARERGDPRSFRDLGAELTGEPPDAPGVRGLIRALPPHWRMGLWSPARQGWGIAMTALFALGTLGTLLARQAREATGQSLIYLDTTNTVHATRPEAADFDGRGDLVRLSPSSSSLAPAARAWPEYAPAVSPDGDAIAWNQDSGDSTTVDIWIRTPAGERRLTREWRDDLVVGWLPDGSGLLGLTNRWSSPAIGGYDVAVFDTATGVARPVTRNDLHEGTPYASPDGTRIAFLREGANGGTQVCVTTFDGLDPAECLMPANQPLAQLMGWGGLGELIITLDSVGARPLLRYDWQRNELTPLAGPQVYRARLSHDRRWVVAALRVDGIGGVQDWIIPLDRPANARRLDRPPSGAEVLRWWEGRPEQSDLVDRIELQDTPRTIQLGFATRLRIRALTSAGTEVPVLAPVRWHSSDTLIARVDASGAVTPRLPGGVTITASLAGWRSLTATFRVRGAPAAARLQEAWDERWRERWITFGEPQPEIATGPGGSRALWNHGDGTYTSLAILREGFSAREGLGVEVRLSTPITDSPWQRSRTALVADLDTVAFRDADQRKAAPSTGNPDATCGANYPNGNGRYGATRLALTGGITQIIDLEPLGSTLGSGSWWTLRIQILPDGRCGFAVNGHVVWISPEPISLDGVFRVRLGDESAGTKLLQGLLQVWTGVRTDIDWGKPEGR